MDLGEKKILIFVSTGRCGTTKIAEMLGRLLGDKDFDVYHQIPGSRFYNILGNILVFLPKKLTERVKEWAYSSILKTYSHNKNFVISDPLTAMMIPLAMISNPNVSIVNIERKPESFAKSMFNFTRKKRNSFIAHNFFLFWQPLLWPLENMLSPRILKKYAKIARFKSEFFSSKYSSNENFSKWEFGKIFSSSLIEEKINSFYNLDVKINEETLKGVVNES